jgi:4-hydroxybutyrate dehydrogenase
MAIIHSFPDIHFDFGAIKELGPELQARGIRKPIIITDRGLVACGVLQQVLDALPASQDHAVFSDIPENPTVQGVEEALAVYQSEGCDGVVGLGGGSVLDSGKALRVIARRSETLLSFLDGSSEITSDVAPYFTIPTTAGTGAEITFGGGIHPTENAVGMGIRSPHIKPDLAICDPELTLTLPPHLTAATGMDALGHCIEGYVSNISNPPVEAIALDGIHRVVTYIKRAVSDGNDREARHNMLMAGLEGGMAIYLGLGPIHALANTFGNSPLHHGTLVTVSAPTVLRFYEGVIDEKLDNIRTAMNLSTSANLAEAIEDLNERIGMPPNVREMGYDGSDLDFMAEETFKSHFNVWAPKKPSLEECRQMVIDALG